MLKIISLFSIFTFVTSVAAEQTDNSTATDENATAITKPTTLEEKTAPRNVNFFLQQCYQNVPPLVSYPKNIDRSQIPVDISADSLTGFAGDIVYQGNVKMVQGDKILTSDSLTYNSTSEQAFADGNTSFVNGQITLYADKMKANLKTDEASLYETEYQFHGQGGRGSAELIYDNGQQLYQLNSSTYTACPPDDSTWSISSSTMYIDNAEEVGSAYNAILKIKGIPVFYTPYINYPLTDKRKTGLLFPKYDSSSVNGITISQPLYINLTANQDLTLTPTYIQNRGLLLKNEYRYLFDIGSGTIATEYLGQDQLQVDEDTEPETRYLIHFDHDVTFLDNWNFSADYTQVSDEDYFNDIDTDYGTQSDGQLLQTAELTYTAMNWNSSLEVRDFQVLDEDEDSYIVLPKLSFSAYQPLAWKSLQFEWYSEITKFDHNDDEEYTGTRLHAEPKIALPLYYDSIFINTELKYMLSFYQQDLGTTDDYDYLDETATRYMPSFKIHSGLNLERDFTLFESAYRQTLVPQMQYLYVPYQDQSNIGLYDTTTLESDYYGLFRDNRYSGYDRIADANQITFGVSSSFINQEGKEKLRFAIGQNYYFEESETTLDEDSDSSDEEEVSRSSMIGEFDVNFEDNYFLHAGLEWDSDDNIIERANTTLEKRWNNNTFLQLSYRYYKEPDDGDWYDSINQVGSKLNWSISTQWSTFASYYYDIGYGNTFESIIGIKYQSCCWAVSLTYDKHMLSYYGEEDDLDATLETENSVELTFELMGLGGTDDTTDDQGLFDYGRPFYLK
jgi:LPS-assembly protein